MKMRPLALALLLPPLLVAAYLAYGDQAITVTGQEHVYDIPRHLEADYSSLLYPGFIKGDDTGRTALLLFSHNDFPTAALEQPWRATMLLFWDRDYGSNGGITSVGRRLVEDTEPTGRVGAFQRYHKSLGTLNLTYFLNFDPDTVSVGQPDRYYVKISRHEPIEFSEFKRASKPGCSLHSVHDGIAVQFTMLGPNCETEQFDSLHATVTEMLRSWQRDKKP